MSLNYDRKLQGSDEMLTGDGKIVNRCLNGEPEAFGMLVDKYRASIYALVYSKVHNFHDAEDITQEIFIKAYSSLRTLKQRDDFHWWLYSISYNYCRNWLRAKSNRPDSEFIEDQSPEEIERILSDPSMAVYQDDIVNEDIHKALNSLPKDYREVLVLYYLGGMDSVEIAKALGTSPTAVRKRLSRAREQFRGEVLAMMGTAYSQQKLTATFTFRIVETVKNIKINPVSTIKGLPWGLSLATGIIITIMSLNPYVSWFSQIGANVYSVLPSETKVLKVGEIPVDIVKTSSMAILSDKMGKGKGGEPKQPNENAFFMVPKVEGGEWVQRADIPTPRYYLSTCAVNGKIYAFGGVGDGVVTSLSTLEEYDPATDTWTKKTDMPVARTALTASVVNGKIYVIGGIRWNNGTPMELAAKVDEYDPVADKWTKKASMITPRSALASCVLNNKIYASGGVTGPTTTTSAFEEYDPATDMWTKKADMPTSRCVFAMGAVNGKIYAIGGLPNMNGGSTAIVEEYDPETNKWTTKANMPIARQDLSASVINEKIYVIGGSSNGNFALSAVEVYDPLADMWTKKTDMLNVRSGLSTSVVNGKIYAIGGAMQVERGVIAEIEEYTPEDWQPEQLSVSPHGKLPKTWGILKGR